MLYSDRVLSDSIYSDRADIESTSALSLYSDRVPSLYSDGADVCSTSSVSLYSDSLYSDRALYSDGDDIESTSSVSLYSDRAYVCHYIATELMYALHHLYHYIVILYIVIVFKFLLWYLG